MWQTIPAEMTRFSPHLGVPPPPLNIELVDAGRAVGWIADARLGFRGFATDIEAAHGAWVAWRALQRRAARRLGERPVPIDTEPLTIRRSETGETILAGTRPIGTLLRPGSGTRAGPDSFAFEVPFSAPIGEIGLRAKAYVVYRSLRKSGIRWALWRPDVTRELATIAETSPVGAVAARLPSVRSIRAAAAAAATDARKAARPPLDAASAHTTRSRPQELTRRARVTFTAITIVAGVVLLAMAPPTLVAPIALFLLAPFLAVQVIVRIDRRNARMHALRMAGSATRDLTVRRPDDSRKEASAGHVLAKVRSGWIASTRRIESMRKRWIAAQGALGARLARRGEAGVRWMGVAMLGATIPAVAFLEIGMRQVAQVLAAVGAVA